VAKVAAASSASDFDTAHTKSVVHMTRNGAYESRVERKSMQNEKEAISTFDVIIEGRPTAAALELGL